MCIRDSCKGDIIYLFNFHPTESPTNFFLPTHPLGAGDYRAVFSSCLLYTSRCV